MGLGSAFRAHRQRAARAKARRFAARPTPANSGPAAAWAHPRRPPARRHRAGGFAIEAGDIVELGAALGEKTGPGFWHRDFFERSRGQSVAKTGDRTTETCLRPVLAYSRSSPVDVRLQPLFLAEARLEPIRPFTVGKPEACCDRASPCRGRSNGRGRRRGKYRFGIELKREQQCLRPRCGANGAVTPVGHRGEIAFPCFPVLMDEAAQLPAIQRHCDNCRVTRFEDRAGRRRRNTAGRAAARSAAGTLRRPKAFEHVVDRRSAVRHREIDESRDRRTAAGAVLPSTPARPCRFDQQRGPRSVQIFRYACRAPPGANSQDDEPVQDQPP